MVRMVLAFWPWPWALARALVLAMGSGRVLAVTLVNGQWPITHGHGPLHTGSDQAGAVDRGLSNGNWQWPIALPMAAMAYWLTTHGTSTFLDPAARCKTRQDRLVSVLLPLPQQQHLQLPFRLAHLTLLVFLLLFLVVLLLVQLQVDQAHFRPASPATSP